MSVDQPYSFIMNAHMHIIILLTFLTVLFFTYITKITKSHIEDSLNDLINDHMTLFLQKVKAKDKNDYINWIVVNDLSKVLRYQYENQVSDINEQNDALLRKVTYVIVGVFILMVILGVYFNRRGHTMGIGVLVLENVVTFMFVGIVELFFFQNIASQYVPVLPTDVTNALFTRLKYNVEKVNI